VGPVVAAASEGRAVGNRQIVEPSLHRAAGLVDTEAVETSSGGSVGMNHRPLRTTQWTLILIVVGCPRARW
jgi:hypothetical protein